MAWSGGVFTRTNGVFSGALVWTDDKNAGTKITSAHHDTHDQDLAQGINACLNKNGQNSPTANIPWGGYKITGLSYGSADKDSATYGQTITAASINVATKVLTLTRTQGDVTVDLTPIVVAGDTSDFARLSLENTWVGVNHFTDTTYLANGFLTETGGTNIELWTHNWTSVGGVEAWQHFYSGAYGSGYFRFVPDTSDPANAYLSINGYKVWNEANLDLSTYLTPTGNYTVFGDWIVSGAWSFSASVQVPALVLAQSGYSWTTSIPSGNVLQFSGTGGNFLKVTTDATHTSKIQTQGIDQYWNSSNLAVTTTAPVDPAGATGDIAIVTAGADKGLWVKLSPGGWTKIL